MTAHGRSTQAGQVSRMAATNTITAGGRQVAVHKADKQMYPGVTKADVVRHYRDVADLMLPGLVGRPLTLRRFPDGIAAKGFIQQEAPAHFPDWVHVETLPTRSDRPPVRHILADDAATLAYLADQGCLEFHSWLSRHDQPDRPDLFVLDLDPPDELPIDELRRAVRKSRDVLSDTGLVPFLRGTGGAGFHLVAPLIPDLGFDDVRAFADEVASRLAADDADLFTTERRRGRRGGAVFVDTGRNAYGQTAVASYSLRARANAPVAVPLDWDELGRVWPDRYTVDNLSRRLAHKQDPWRDLFDSAGSVPRARSRLARRFEASPAAAKDGG